MPILTPQERLGTQIGGRYRVDRILAQGGMSVLFHAFDTRVQRAVALKIQRADDSLDASRLERFKRELRLTAELRHPHVVDVLDFGQDDAGVPFLVLELLQGRSLQAELQARGTLPPSEALDVLLPIMAALASVHEAGVIHRDIKPDNIFLHVEPGGRVQPKLLDFGIAKIEDAGLCTRTGALLGTPEYMAPEQVLGRELGPAVDVWAMGAVLYRTLAGVTPFRAATVGELVAKLAREAPPPLEAVGLSLAFCAAIDRALSREPRSRYADMREFMAALLVCARRAELPLSCALAKSFEVDAAAFAIETRTISGPAPLRGRKRAAFRVAVGAALLAVGLLQPSTQSVARPPRPPAPVEAMTPSLPPAAALPPPIAAPELAEPPAVPAARKLRVKKLRARAAPDAQPLRVRDLPIAVVW